MAPGAAEVVPDATYKIVLVGESGVGKTNLLASFAARNEEQKQRRRQRGESGEDAAATAPAETYGPRAHKLLVGYSENHQPTIGCEFFSTTVRHPLDGSLIGLQIWDTAGQERYRSVAAGQYRRAAGALLVYDVTRRASLEAATSYWHKELSDWPLSECVCLVGNKTDIFDESNPSHVSLADHMHAAKLIMARSSERTSAKTGSNVSDAFMRLVFQVHEASKGEHGSNGTGGALTTQALDSDKPYDRHISLDHLKRAVEGENGGAQGEANNCCA